MFDLDYIRAKYKKDIVEYSPINKIVTIHAKVPVKEFIVLKRELRSSKIQVDDIRVINK